MWGIDSEYSKGGALETHVYFDDAVCVGCDGCDKGAKFWGDDDSDT